MRELKIQKLSHEAFHCYGEFASLLVPNWPATGLTPKVAFLDLVSLNLGLSTTASLSICRVAERELSAEAMEYHNQTCEGLLPLDGDILIQVAPAGPTMDIPEKLIEVFLVPKGTFVRINPGVWHGWPFAYGCDQAHVLIILPPRAYVHDCHLVDLKKQREIMSKK